jgi:DNA polymerase-1
MLGPVLEGDAVTKVFIDAKQADLHLRTSGLRVAGPYEDLHLMSYLLNPANPWRMLAGLEELEPDMLARLAKEEAKAGRAYWSAEKAGPYLAAMAQLAKELRARLEAAGLLALYKEAEEPLALILGDMERQGICIAPEVLREQGDMLNEKIASAEAEIYEAAGLPFNINSPKQLGEILFGKLGLPKGKKTKTGYSTDADTLESLAGEHRIAAMILGYRQYAKLRSTYVEGLLAIMDPASNRVHSSLNQTITVTGRLSSTEPNLQNIPIRMEEGRRIRRAFVPSPGCCFLSGDYSQIELRLLAHLCGDEALRQAFLEGQDIHRGTASEVFGVSLADVTPQQRQAAKAVNFGLIYGISDFGLAQDLGITKGEAKEYMDRYFNRYPGVRTYFDRLLMEADERGYVETAFGRRRYLPELKSGNYHTRSFGQRAAMNAPLQGTAADIMKFAMVAVKKILAREGLGGAMVLQVHDELLFDIPEDRARALMGEIRAAMENVAALSVPLLVDMKIGNDWYSMEEIS